MRPAAGKSVFPEPTGYRQDSKIDALRSHLAKSEIWALMLYMSLAALNFGALARDFGWI